MGDKTLVRMYKGNWKLSGNHLTFTYTWSSHSKVDPGTSERVEILEGSENYLELKSEKTGQIVRYTRK